jgi:hypothetical protein
VSDARVGLASWCSLGYCYLRRVTILLLAHQLKRFSFGEDKDNIECQGCATGSRFSAPLARPVEASSQVGRDIGRNHHHSPIAN